MIRQKFFNRAFGIRILIALVLSVLYGILSGRFFLRLIDGLSIAAVLFLFLGLLVYWWKEGFFSFFFWKKEEEPSFLKYRQKVVEERKHADNHSLYAGLWLLAVSLILTVLYQFIH